MQPVTAETLPLLGSAGLSLSTASWALCLLRCEPFKSCVQFAHALRIPKGFFASIPVLYPGWLPLPLQLAALSNALHSHLAMLFGTDLDILIANRMIIIILEQM